MNTKHALLGLSVFAVVSFAYAEREVFAPSKLAPVAEAGTIQFDDGTAAAPSMTFKDDTNTGVFSTAGDNNVLGFSTNGTERMRITSAGGVGIGTSSPSAQLHVESNAFTESSPAFRALYTGGANAYFTPRSTDAVFGTASTHSLILNTNNQGRIHITAGGRVLINNGTSVAVGSGDGQIQVSGTDANSASQSIARYSANGSGPAFAFGKSRSASVGGQTAVGNGDRLGIISFNGSDGADMDNNGGAAIQSTVTGTPTTGNVPAGLEFFTTAEGGAFTERMRITAAGDLVAGNGDTSATPAASTIRGTNGSGTDITGGNITIQAGNGTGSGGSGRLSFFTASPSGSGSTANTLTERMRINRFGTVVIGNGDSAASPGNGNILGTAGSGSNVAGAALVLGGGAGTGSANGGDIRFRTAPAGSSGSSENAHVERMRINSAGVLLMAAGSKIDSGGAKFELPNDTALPATCVVGELFQDTDSDDCANTAGGDGALCICKATDTWALIANF